MGGHTLNDGSDALHENVILPYGPIQGIPRDSRGVLAFKGIPYAAPPVGALRWRPPCPPGQWHTVRKTTEFGFTAWAAVQDWPTATKESEDCLTLNVWTAALQRSEKRPVMLWIHGGGFQFGSSADPIFDGAGLAQKGVILVSCNYRVGVFGFMALPELDEEESPSGNFGLQDQIAVLRWIQENIHRFGGDPQNVTVFGESAGAHAIGLLMASPLCINLFHKAILQSGAYWDTNHGSLTSFREARQRGAKLSDQLGATCLADLRQVPASALSKAAAWRLGTDPALSAFSPNIDGYVVPEVPAQVFNDGRQMKIPILAGWNAKEELPFLALASPHHSSNEFKLAAKARFGDQTAEFLMHYPSDTDAQAMSSAEALIGDLIISQQTWDLLDTHSRTSKFPVYAYYYTYTSAYSPIASHAADQDFVFGTLSNSHSFFSRGAANDQDQSFACRLMLYWTNFARKSQPNDPQLDKLPEWPIYDTNNPVLLELGIEIKPLKFSFDRFRFLRSLRNRGALPTNWRRLDAGTD